MPPPKKRGRRSAAEQALTKAKAAPVVVTRPDPPTELTDEQCGVWNAVVDSHPADWFGPSAYPVLIQYCRHVVAARRVAQLIEQLVDTADGLNVLQFDKLLATQDRESRAIASLATKLRITPQATTNHRGNKVDNSVRKPWQSEPQNV